MEIFVVIWFVLFFWIIGKGIAQFIENENSLVLTGPATIVDMRGKTHHHQNHHSHYLCEGKRRKAGTEGETAGI